jgi:hypothetical protein
MPLPSCACFALAERVCWGRQALEGSELALRSEQWTVNSGQWFLACYARSLLLPIGSEEVGRGRGYMEREPWVSWGGGSGLGVSWVGLVEESGVEVVGAS